MDSPEESDQAVPPRPSRYEVLLSGARQRFGDLLHVTGYEQASKRERAILHAHLADAARLPLDLVQRVVTAGLRGVFIGVGAVPDLDEMDYLHAEPRHLMIIAVYDRDRKYIVASTRATQAVPQHDFLHEFGHAVGDLLLLNDRDEVRILHEDAGFWLRLALDFRGHRPGDPRGRREVLAEAIRDRILDRDAALEFYGETFMAWLEQKLSLQ